MKNSILTGLMLFAMTANFAAPSLADKKSAAARSRASELVALLPASDAVASMDAGRFLNDAMPKLLAGNPTLLGKLTSAMEEAQSKTGVDMRQFDSVAGGFNIKKVGEKDFDIDPVVVARGQINSGAVISAAKLAADGKFREEKVGARSIFIFKPTDFAKKQLASDPKTAAAAKKAAGKLARESAVTAVDANTIAVGTIERVRELIAAKTRVSPELAGYLGRTDGAIFDFAAKVPAGLSAFIPLDSDELGKNIDSIRVMYGSMAMSGDTTLLNATAKTVQPEQARALKDTLDGLQMIGKAFLGSAKGADKQALARMIENARITQTGSEVSLALSVPQSDIDVLTAMIK